ncbi:MAG: GYDIA family GHMP kinase [Saonia sp.]
MSKRLYSNGKLLLTGEYVVLDGALSLAVPTRYGQSMTVKEIDTPELVWKSLDDSDTIWFEETFELDSFKHHNKKQSSSPPFQKGKEIADTLYSILKEAKEINPSFLRGPKGFEVETKLYFPRDWGLGSSSTLINNIAQWAKVDAYELLWKAFSGSGYDIACAQYNKPILYQLNNSIPIVEKIDLDLPFNDCIYFIHLNKKQNSREAIAQYQNINFNMESVIRQISEITLKIVSCRDLSVFEGLLMEHEQLLSHILGIPMVKESLFPNFNGAIKSLGAWGGDFILATGNKKIPEYFKKKGFETVIPYAQMVL